VSAIEINSVVYDGSPASPSHPFPPDAVGVERRQAPVGETIVADSGIRRFVTRSVRKPQWKHTWTNANATTRNAVKAAAELDTTFPFKDQFGVSFTVQCEDSDIYTEATAFTKHDNTSLYNLTISFHLAT
jgi:hypothetical protein